MLMITSPHEVGIEGLYSPFPFLAAAKQKPFGSSSFWY
jgi:hypothetical protein